MTPDDLIHHLEAISSIMRSLHSRKEDATLNCNFMIPNMWQAMREAASSKAKPLTVENVAGAFLVLIIGLVMATATATTEFLWAARKIFTSENVGKRCIVFE